MGEPGDADDRICGPLPQGARDAAARRRGVAARLGAEPVVLEQRDDQGRAAEVPLPQSEEHDEIAAQLERMEKGDDNDEGTAGDDSKGREGTYYYCLVYPNSQKERK